MKFHSCCPSYRDDCQGSNKLDRRKFIKVVGGTTLSVAALSGLTWKALAGNPFEEHSGVIRRALVAKPILVYSTPEYKYQTSWRAWGGIQTEQDGVMCVGNCFRFPVQS